MLLEKILEPLMSLVENQSFFPNTYLQGESLSKDKFFSHDLPNLPKLSKSMPPICFISLAPDQELSREKDQGVNATIMPLQVYPKQK